MEKHDGDEGHRPLHNMAHALCMLGKQGYTRALTHTHQSASAPTQCKRTRTHILAHARARTHTEIYNTYCFSQEIIVSRKRLNITLLIYFLPCAHLPNSVPVLWSTQPPIHWVPEPFHDGKVAGA